jgi:hypothetical protein
LMNSVAVHAATTRFDVRDGPRPCEGQGNLQLGSDARRKGGAAARRLRVDIRLEEWAPAQLEQKVFVKNEPVLMLRHDQRIIRHVQEEDAAVRARINTEINRSFDNLNNCQSRVPISGHVEYGNAQEAIIIVVET